MVGLLKGTIKRLLPTSRSRKSESKVVETEPSHSVIDTKVSHPLFQSLSDGQFRLAEVQPSSSDSETIRVKLITVHISHPPVFELLSHVWGMPSSSTVLCDGHSVPVWANLFEALRVVRTSTKPRLVWTSALCVNQEDMSEKPIQIGLEKRITLAASHTIVWAGTATEDNQSRLDDVHDDIAKAAFQLVSTLVAARSILLTTTAQSIWILNDLDVIRRYREALPPDHDLGWSGIEKLLSANVFQRVWRVMDFVFSARLTIYWGSSQLQWNDLVNALEAYNLYGYPNMIKVPRAHSILLIDSIRQRWLTRQDITFEHLVGIYQPLKATNPLDRVYSMYPLLNNIDIPGYTSPDYDVAVNDAFTTAALLMESITSDVPYIILSLSYEVQKKTHVFQNPLPSWVPDFGVPRELSPYLLNSSQNLFHASGNMGKTRNRTKLHFRTPNTNGAELLGMVVDTVYQLACYMPPRRPCDRLNVGSVNSFFFSEWFDWAVSNQLVKYMGNEARLLSDWVETIQAKGSDNWFNSWNKDPVQWMGTAKRWLEYLETEECEETEEIRQFHAFCLPSYGRRLAVTKQGRFCLVPRYAEPGDLVCIPSNSKVPFVFRKVASLPLEADVDRLSYTCRNVGECYVHGAMHGEAREWDGVKDARIILV
ncbi:heterokaryon incompatibility protein-domain-containing protein [Xylariales sp. PMI_506]|nr:heterokaryon incompatibility protein-domain-containing protein [Xylariales sp. PMI_506]